MLRHFLPATLAVAASLVLIACSKSPEVEPSAAEEEALRAKMQQIEQEPVAQAASNAVPDRALPDEVVACGVKRVADLLAYNAEVARFTPNAPIPFAVSHQGSEFYWDGAIRTQGAVMCMSNSVTQIARDSALLLVNKVAHQRTVTATTYVPPAKDQFEKTADYDARIAKERAAFEAKAGGGRLTIGELAMAWSALLGKPEIKKKEYGAGALQDAVSYNADAETLSLVVQSTLEKTETSLSGGAFEIPLAIKLAPDDAKSFMSALLAGGSSCSISPVVRLELVEAALWIRDVSFVPSADCNDPKLMGSRKALQAFTMPVDQVVPARFGW